MTTRDIVSYPDDRLRRVAAEVADPRALTALAQDMFDTMRDAGGLGLAGPQIGVSQRIFVMDCRDEDPSAAPRAVINPQIIWRSDARADYEEGCLSIMGPKSMVTRPAEVGMRWMDIDGQPQEARFSGIEAVCVQHELDHLNGVLFIDLISAGEKARVLREFRDGTDAPDAE